MPNAFVSIFDVDMCPGGSMLTTCTWVGKQQHRGPINTLYGTVHAGLTTPRTVPQWEGCICQENICKVINWRIAEERFLGGCADAFKALKTSTVSIRLYDCFCIRGVRGLVSLGTKLFLLYKTISVVCHRRPTWQVSGIPQVNPFAPSGCSNETTHGLCYFELVDENKTSRQLSPLG